MKVEFIGSGSIFTSVNSASYLINDKILVDIPNGCCKALKRMGKDIIDIKYVFITHFHGDHFFDIPFLLAEIYLRGSKKVTLIGGSELKSKVEAITKLCFPNSYNKYLNEIEITYVDCNEKISIDDLKINSVKVEHGRIKEAYGYMFAINNKSIFFTGDTCLCSNVEKLCNISSYIIIDTTLEIGNKAHIGINDIEYLATKYNNVKFITTHMGKDIKNLIEKLNLKNVISGEDGFKFKVD